METNKYQQALKNFPLLFTDDYVKTEVSKIISEKFNENNHKDTYKKIYNCIDLTTLNPTDSKESIWRLTEKVNEMDGDNPEVENVAAICVFPNFVSTVKEALTADIKIASVAGGFPSSQTFIEIKIAEVSLAIADGAEEIDTVINLGSFLQEDFEEMCEELMEIRDACKEVTLKVILETGALKTAQNIHNASILSLHSGADFLKTSTGKGYLGATPEALFVMCHAIKSYYEANSIKKGIKVSGGVSTPEEAVKYFTIVKEILGEDWCDNSLFRIGTSRLADIMLTEINKE